ncbi:hypothetical protein UCDDS831_g08715 [Diplodia seriata]|uniref:F-box domain-containing protein n=1 Tax=Diplodia seriata TaxID=420778 RepID=A0A0G2G9E2_9PEZI|nr:hypothetical protein UCDDS831_g08715 [Diplodia seriata]
MDDADLKLFLAFYVITGDAIVGVGFSLLLNAPDSDTIPPALWAFLVLTLPVPCLIATLTFAWFVMEDIQDLMQKLRRWVVRAPKRLCGRLMPRTQEETGVARLPNELLLQIVAHLPATDALALHATCRRLRRLYYPHAATLDDRADLAARCRRDDFARACQAQRDGKLKHGALVCSYCRATHPRNHFAAHERARPLERRRCLGATTAVALCPHRAVRHEQLLAAAQCSREPMLRCEPCDAEAWPYIYNSSHLSSVTLKRTYFRMQVPRHSTIPRPTLAAAVAASGGPICPHMDAEEAARRFPDSWLRMPWDGSAVGSAAVRCDDIWCNARLELELELQPREKGAVTAVVIAMKSKRLLFLVTKTGAVHERWMNACIEASSSTVRRLRR